MCRLPGRGIRGFALASHRERRPDAPAAPPRRHRGGRGDRGGGLHRPVDRVLPARDRPRAADRDRRARDRGLRRLRAQRRLVLGAVPAGVQRDRAPPRPSGRGRGAARDARVAGRGGPRGGARGHRGRLRARRDDLACTQRGAAHPGARAGGGGAAADRAGGGARAAVEGGGRGHRAGHAGPRRHLHAPLRRRASAEARARARGAGRGARRLAVRAHAVHPAWGVASS